MAKKRPAKRTAAPKRAKGAAPPSVAAQLPDMTPEQVDAARRRYERGVLARSEAARAGAPLSRGQTHESTGTRGDGTPAIKRNRFSAR